MNGLLSYRAASKADLSEILRLYAQPDLDDGKVLPLSEAERIFQRMARYPDYMIYVAVCDDQIVGTFALLIMDNLGHMGTPLAVIDVAVDPAWQGRGVGNMMIHYALEVARQKGCYKAVLSLNLKRERAHAFYESLGFERHGTVFVSTPNAPRIVTRGMPSKRRMNSAGFDSQSLLAPQSLRTARLSWRRRVGEVIRSISTIFPFRIMNVTTTDSRRCETATIPTFPFTSASAICTDPAFRAPASAPLATISAPHTVLVAPGWAATSTRRTTSGSSTWRSAPKSPARVAARKASMTSR
jgi:GNAT superfamily N-acetyltransferase